MERIKDYLLMEHEFVQTQEQLKPHDERTEEDRSKVIAPVAAEPMRRQCGLEGACVDCSAG
jgi:hypothetical protein